ncbi:MAG: translation initiation factor IF-2, partial [Anaerolineales bacterium]
LSVGDTVLAGTAYGRIKAMFDYFGTRVQKAGPSTPISVMGLNDVPEAGELFQVVKSEKSARVIVAERKEKRKAAIEAAKTSITLEKLFEQFQAGEVRELRLIIKADVQGSLEPIISSLNDLRVEDIAVNILHAQTGNIGENDVMLAAASKAVVIGFNAQADTAVRRLADFEGVSIRNYNIIYRLMEDVEKALKGMLAPEEKTTVIGKAEVRAVFKIPKLGRIAGCYVTGGVLKRNAQVRVLRNSEIMFIGEMASLKHHTEDVREIRQGFECGVGVKGFTNFKSGDFIECVVTELVPVA